MQIADPSISSPEREFVIRFVKFGAFNRPASNRTATVLAADRRSAFRILKRKYPRSDRYEVVSEKRSLLPA